MNFIHTLFHIIYNCYTIFSQTEKQENMLFPLGAIHGCVCWHVDSLAVQTEVQSTLKVVTVQNKCKNVKDWSIRYNSNQVILRFSWLTVHCLLSYGVWHAARLEVDKGVNYPIVLCTGDNIEMLANVWCAILFLTWKCYFWLPHALFSHDMISLIRCRSADVIEITNRH